MIEIRNRWSQLMQYPQYSSSNSQYSLGSPQSPSPTPKDGYSVLQKRTVANQHRDRPAQLQSTTDDLRTSQSLQVFNGHRFNLSDQPETTWRRRSQSQILPQKLTMEQAPLTDQTPANVHSFAPPADLKQLQRIDRPQNQRPLGSDIYKSPIDRPYVGEARRTVEQSNVSNEGVKSLDETLGYFNEQPHQNATVPARDDVTEAIELLSIKDSEAGLVVEPSQPDATTASGKKLIVLQSQSPKTLAQMRVQDASSAKPDAQLLTPNFESYAGSPSLETTRDAYQDTTQWQVYTPKVEVVDIPPQAIFESKQRVIAQEPTVEFSSPVPSGRVFEPAEEIAGLPAPEPVTESTPSFEPATFAPPAPASIKRDNFVASADSPESQFRIAKAETAMPRYRFERYETAGDVQANTTAMTVAHTKETAPASAVESPWLSPWWMLVCLIPLAMYVAMRRDSDVDDEYGYDGIDDRPRIPEEIIERPGYSKSDAVYGTTDDFFSSEQTFSQEQPDSIAAEIPMATKLSADTQSIEDLQTPSLEETTTNEPAPELRLAGSESVQIDFELDGDASPNFRSKVEEDKEDDGEFEIPDWLN